MSRVLQWLIGICFILVTAAIVFSLVAPFFLSRVGLAIAGTAPQLGRGFGFGPGHMFGGRMMMGGFRLPFMGLGMLIGPLIIIGLIILVVALFTRRSPAPAAAAAIPAAPMPAPSPVAPATTPCTHCGQPLEAGWKACPYCGEKV
jgi:hypothetical protein